MATPTENLIQQNGHAEEHPQRREFFGISIEAYKGLVGFALLRMVREELGPELTRSMFDEFTNEQHETNSSCHGPEQVRSTLIRLGVDQALIKFYSTHFSHLPADDPQRLAKDVNEMRLKANEIVEQVRTMVFPGTDGVLKSLNEVRVPERDLLYPMSHILSDTVDEGLKLEFQRQELITLLLLSLEEYIESKGFKDTVQYIKNLFDEQLFIGDTGQTGTQIYYSKHDNTTNNCLDVVTEAPTETEPGTHWKCHPVKCRDIKGIGLAITEWRIKGYESAVIKALYKAIISDPDTVVCPEAVKDVAGHMFVTETEEERNALYEKIKTMLLADGNFEEVKDDHSVNGNRGQSSQVVWLRMQVTPKSENGDAPMLPTEIAVLTMQDYLNYNNSIEGQIEALAHDIFKLRRTAEVGNLLYSDILDQLDSGTRQVVDSIVERGRKSQLHNVMRDLLEGSVYEPVPVSPNGNELLQNGHKT